MLVYCDFNPGQLYYSLHELIRLAYPACRIIREPGPEEETRIQIRMERRPGAAVINGAILSPQGNTVLKREEQLRGSEDEQEGESGRAVRRFTYQMLCRHIGKSINPYGILTGVRPVKLVHRLMDVGFSGDKIEKILTEHYLLDTRKASLLQEVAANNRPYLLSREQAQKLVSIYIGIPFCPSRCSYCSFPGAVLKNYDLEIKPFLKALHYEMARIANYLQQQDISIQTIYIGGGTPTVLSETDLEEMLDLIRQHFITPQTREITVEAGRPDTLNPLKLHLMKQAGVNRICVNPQTMNDSTLIRIGRNHDKKGVLRSIEWVREAGIQQINMDLIVGLPGENLPENISTAEKILELNPDNITVHTLSLKRGSEMAETEERARVGDRVREVQEGIDYYSRCLREAGYLPYYMYRQKYMKAGMENTGYARPGYECLYNIQMIEERQTIIGLGGGAGSKFIRPLDWRLSAVYNPKNPAAYQESVEKLIQRKVDKLWALN